MKKQYFLIFIAAAVMAAGCTSPEQDEKIRLFWMQQMFAMMKKLPAGLPQPARQMPSVAGAPVRMPQTEQRVPARPRNQVMDVTIDTEAMAGPAPYAERVRMKRAWDAVQLSNQHTLNDIATAFGDQVKNSAFVITTNTEKQLKQVAKESNNFMTYFTRQQELLTKQEQDLNALMAQNRTKIRKLKKTNTSL